MAVEVQHMELAAHMGLNMFNCYAIEGLKAAILASSLKCPGFATVMLNLGLPPIATPKNSDPKVTRRTTNLTRVFFFVKNEAEEIPIDENENFFFLHSWIPFCLESHLTRELHANIFINQVSEWMKEYIASTKLTTFGFRPAASFYGKTFKESARELGNNNIAALAVQV